MPRIDREDRPGTLHHVVSRGVGRRTVFESDADVRVFAAQLARAVRIGDLEVLAYSVLATHYHLLVRSPRGRLSAAMQRVLECTALRFNRTRGRDGPLFRGRFWSRPVTDEDDQIEVARYIDNNPVGAGLATRPEEYPHGSARHYAAAVAPPWLARGHLRGLAARVLPGVDGGQAYRAVVWGEFDRQSNAWRIERRADRRLTRPRGGGPLWNAAACVRDERRRTNDNADGHPETVATHAPSIVLEAVADLVRGAEGATVGRGRGRRAAVDVLRASALVRWCGVTGVEAGARLGISPGSLQRRLRAHARARAEGGEYARLWKRLERALATGDDIPGVESVIEGGATSDSTPGMLPSDGRGLHSPPMLRLPLRTTTTRPSDRTSGRRRG